jgi:hypothetical protein
MPDGDRIIADQHVLDQQPYDALSLLHVERFG